MTPNEITTTIAVQLKKELDDVYKLILFQSVGTWRARLIRNSLEKKPNEAKFFMQTLYVPMQSRNVQPDCISIPNTCPAAVSVSKLPTPLRYTSELFDFVGSADGKRTFSYGTLGGSEYLSAGKYSKNTIFFDWIENRLVVEGHPNLPMAMKRAVFDAPEEVMQLNCDSGVDCDYWNSEYPITKELLQQVIQYIVAEQKGELVNTGKQIEINPQPVAANEQDGR